MNREKADQWLSNAVMALVVVQVLCGVLFTGMVRAQDFLIAQGLAVPILLLWTARLWTAEKESLLWPPACWCGLAFVVYAILRTWSSDIPYIARSELLKALVYAVTFVAALHSFRSRGAQRALLWILVGLGVASSLYAIYQAVIDPDHVWHFKRPEVHGYGRRGSGFFINPNHLATLLALILPLALSYCALSRLSILAKAGLGASAVVMMVGIVVTVSRGGWIATAMALMFFVIVMLGMRGRRAVVIGAVALLVGVGAFVVSRSELAKVRVDAALNREATGNIRYAIWGTAWAMWRDHKMFGVGPGHFDRRYREYRAIEMQARPGRAHNDYVDALADWGAVGLGIGLAGVAAVLIGAGRAWRGVRGRVEESGAHRSDRLALILGLTCSGVAWLVHIFFDFASHIPGLAMLAALLAALLTAQIRSVTPRYRVQLNTGVRAGFTAVSLATALFLGVQEVSRYREFRALEAAAWESGTFDQAIVHLRQALEIEPTNPDTPFVIGEAFRLESWKNPPDFEEKAETAIKWLQESIAYDPYDPVRRLRLGQCLDWLDRPGEAWKFYEAALKLDPLGYHTASVVGWHFAHVEDFEKARIWYELSVSMEPGRPNSDSWEQLRLLR